MHNVYFWRLKETDRLINYYEHLFKCKQKEPTDYQEFNLYTTPYKYKFIHYFLNLFFTVCDASLALLF